MRMSNPFFSVIIPSFNRYKNLINAIESVLNQTFADFELIVIDDGSTDETYKIKDNYSSRLIYIYQENKGVSGARNKGILVSRGEYIAFLDSDDIWLEEKLQEHKLFIEQNPDTLIHQTEDIWIRGGVRVNKMVKHSKKYGYIFKDSLKLCLISPSAVVMKKSLFGKYGMFNENLPACEDYDLWLRITIHERVGLIKKNLLIRYGGHDDQLSSKYWGMDRFRIYSIINLIKKNKLSIEYKKSAEKIVIKKLTILRNGSLKRGRKEFAENIDRIIEYINCENYSNIDCEILLERLNSL
jgi:glycosyltransferase involved in cell wall biosynthesis